MPSRKANSKPPQRGVALQRLVRLHQEAAEAIVAEVKRLFPLGTVLDVRIHRNWIRAEVTGHGESWWYQPGCLHLRNLKTDRQRKVTVGTLADGDYAVVESNAEVCQERSELAAPSGSPSDTPNRT